MSSVYLLLGYIALIQSHANAFFWQIHSSVELSQQSMNSYDCLVVSLGNYCLDIQDQWKITSFVYQNKIVVLNAYSF